MKRGHLDSESGLIQHGGDILIKADHTILVCVSRGQKAGYFPLSGCPFQLLGEESVNLKLLQHSAVIRVKRSKVLPEAGENRCITASEHLEGRSLWRTHRIRAVLGHAYRLLTRSQRDKIIMKCKICACNGRGPDGRLQCLRAGLLESGNAGKRHFMSKSEGNMTNESLAPPTTVMMSLDSDDG